MSASKDKYFAVVTTKVVKAPTKAAAQEVANRTRRIDGREVLQFKAADARAVVDGTRSINAALVLLPE